MQHCIVLISESYVGKARQKGIGTDDSKLEFSSVCMYVFNLSTIVLYGETNWGKESELVLTISITVGLMYMYTQYALNFDLTAVYL